MNSRQRRGVILLLATIVAAIALFVSIFLYVKEIDSQVGPQVDVLVLAKDVKELAPLTPADVTTVKRPEKWISASTLRDKTEVEGMVASGDYRKGTTLQGGMVIKAPTVQPDFREIGMMVDAETGVAGKIRSGDRVDIIATTEGKDGENRESKVWVENALVVEVGIPTTVKNEDGADFMENEKVPVTFALPVDQSLALAYAESFGKEVRLALRGRGDQGESTPVQFPEAPKPPQPKQPAAQGGGEQ